MVPTADSLHELPQCLHAVDGELRTPVGAGFAMCIAPSKTYDSPAEVDQAGTWLSAQLPTTVAATLRHHALWSWQDRRDFDACDVWFRGSLPRVEAARLLLELAAVATLTTVFLNGQRVAHSDSMFRRMVLDVTGSCASGATLHLLCAGLDGADVPSGPRARWRTSLVENAKLRHLRTTMLGRMPGVLSHPAAVGPFRPIELVAQHAVAWQALRLRPVVRSGKCSVTLAGRFSLLGGATIAGASLAVADRTVAPVVRASADGGYELSAELHLPDAALWWPHTHGEQPHYPASVTLRLSTGDHLTTLRPIAFRELRVDSDQGRFGFVVNGVCVFSRGACWMPPDPVGLQSEEAVCRRALEQAKEAGMNMLRLSGITTYEAPVFHQLCDELGILVWQDLAFANLDYPTGATFLAEVRAELHDLLERIEDRPSTALICGNSEAEQQAAMMGLTAPQRCQPLFEEHIPTWLAKRGDLPYWPSTPHGGLLPFRTDEGTTHFYGVGAYEGPLEGLREARVKFSPECLAFSHVPEDEGLAGLGPQAAFHTPDFRAGVPRDNGASWDFGDTTDHYVERFFNVDSRAIRRTDPERHLQLTRRAPGMAIAAVQRVWRRPSDPCEGALLWTLRDLRPGAGWGIVDHMGIPKAAYYAVKRLWAPRAMWFCSEGLNGLRLWIVNEPSDAVQGTLHVRLLRLDGTTVGRAELNVDVSGRGFEVFDVEEQLGYFADASYAYHFGPPSHAAAVATLQPVGGAPPLCTTLVLDPASLPIQRDLGLEAEATPIDDGAYQVAVRTNQLAHSVHIDAPGYDCSDNYFDVIPDETHRLVLRARPGQVSRPPRVRLRPLNAMRRTTVEIAP